MISKELNSNNAIVLCGHGSRNSNYILEFVRLKEKLEKKIDFDFYSCFIEINKPSIKDCIVRIIKEYDKIFFFPLLLFEGKHLIKDINKEISTLTYKYKEKIHFINKLSLTDDIFPSMKKVLNKKDFRQFDTLVTSCSFSKSNKVIEELEAYTNELSNNLKFKNHFFYYVGDEKKLFEELNKKNNISKKILLHPIFFFDGYLYQKSINVLSKSFSTSKLLPLSNYQFTIDIISKKLVSRI